MGGERQNDDLGWVAWSLWLGFGKSSVEEEACTYSLYKYRWSCAHFLDSGWRWLSKGIRDNVACDADRLGGVGWPLPSHLRRQPIGAGLASIRFAVQHLHMAQRPTPWHTYWKRTRRAHTYVYMCICIHMHRNMYLSFGNIVDQLSSVLNIRSA